MEKDRREGAVKEAALAFQQALSLKPLADLLELRKEAQAARGSRTVARGRGQAKLRFLFGGLGGGNRISRVLGVAAQDHGLTPGIVIQEFLDGGSRMKGFRSGAHAGA